MNIAILGSGKMGKDISILFSQARNIKKIYLISTFSKTSKKRAEFQKYIKESSIALKLKYEIVNFKKIELTNHLFNVSDCDFILETVIEDKPIKIDLIKKVNNFVKKETIFFTNTSSLNLKELQQFYKYKENFFGMHFFNPVFKTKLIELIYINNSQKKSLNVYAGLLTDLKRKPVIIKSFPGYIVNRILLSQINEACYILENQSISAKDIDDAYKAATNNLQGPFEVSDLIGIDVVLYMLESLFQQTNDSKFKPNKILNDMVNDNKLGVKTKSGFYDK